MPAHQRIAVLEYDHPSNNENLIKVVIGVGKEDTADMLTLEILSCHQTSRILKEHLIKKNRKSFVFV